MIGDVLASSVICTALKRTIRCETHYLINRNTFPVVQHHPDIDHFILTDPERNSLQDFVELGKQLRAHRFDAIIDAYGIWESIIPLLVSKAPVRIGFRKWYTQFFYTKVVSVKEGIPGSAIAHRLQLAEALTEKPFEIRFPKIYLTRKEVTEAKYLIGQHAKGDRPLLMISALGSAPDKSMPAQHMAQILDRIAESEVEMILNFMPSQQAEADRIYEACLPGTQAKILRSLTTGSLREFLAVLSRCQALIGNEGGAVNMAKALDVPTFTVFSPWINKSSWDMLTDTDAHVAVHLNDFHPEIYRGVHPKKFRVQADLLYKMLRPELFAAQLQTFIGKIIADYQKDS